MSNSPSPPPQAPIASAPGARVAALHKVFRGALSSSIRANSYDNFSSCFPTPAKYCPTALEGVWKQLNTRLEEECMRDFEKILEERSVVEGLNQWDGMIEEARRAKNRAVEGEEPPVPLHKLSAEELYTAHLTPFIQQASEELNTKLQQTQQDNANKMNEISEQRAEIARLLATLQGAVKEVEAGVQATMQADGGGFDGNSLRTDVWDMEQEIMATRQ
ncbi:hypothetical protein B0A52_01827 [Exophiala mesophila]|uniref:MIND kinetochore complex component Nnf1 n=1 Tax=Exophiala mesophila TaxID=212818 RepID=A0A438NG39_EXOME|nr:hypothetical protein B0A52_01827 [Exophiala mesophila]